MTFEEIYKYCSEYPGLNCEPDEVGGIRVLNSIFSGGWDYFMTIPDTDVDGGRVAFYPMLYKMPEKYCTSNYLVEIAKYENTSFERKGNDVIGLTQEKLKEYLERLSISMKELKVNIQKVAIEKDFEE